MQVASYVVRLYKMCRFALIIMQTNIKLLEIQGLLIIRCGFNFGNNINQRNLISREQYQLIVFVGIFLNNESLSFIYIYIYDSPNEAIEIKD